VDAAAAVGKVSVVGHGGLWGQSFTPTLLSYMQGLGRNMHQLAELYVVRVAVCVGNKLVCSWDNGSIIVSESQSVIFSCLNMTVRAKYQHTGKGLRQIVRAVGDAHFVPGSINPADDPSQMLSVDTCSLCPMSHQ